MARNRNRRHGNRNRRSPGPDRAAKSAVDASPAGREAPAAVVPDAGGVRTGRTRQRRFGHN